MGLPFRGGYSASKGALQIISEALRMEVTSLALRCTLAPGDYATDIASRRYYEPNKKGSAYEALYEESLATWMPMWMMEMIRRTLLQLPD